MTIYSYNFNIYNGKVCSVYYNAYTDGVLNNGIVGFDWAYGMDLCQSVHASKIGQVEAFYTDKNDICFRLVSQFDVSLREIQSLVDSQVGTMFDAIKADLKTEYQKKEQELQKSIETLLHEIANNGNL